MNEELKEKPEAGDMINCGEYKRDFKKIIVALVDDGWFLTVGKNVMGDYVIRLEDKPGERKDEE